MNDIDMTKLRVLVIDDRAFTREIIETVLFELGISNVTQAVNGVDALSKFSTIDANFDVVICDLEMPNMNGFEFVKQLRENTHLPCTNVPVLIVTSHSDENSVQRAVEAGIHGYLVKPVSKQELEKRISAAIRSPVVSSENFK